MRSLHLMYIDGTETSEEAKTNSFGPKNGAINWHGLIACISVVRSFYDVQHTCLHLSGQKNVTLNFK